MATKKKNVLFLCAGNSARLLMAAALLRDISVNKGRFSVFTACDSHLCKVDPLALEQIKRNHLSVAGLPSKSWAEFAVPDAPVMDFVFALGELAASDTLPVWPGRPLMAHWDIPDPADERGNEMDRRRAFVASFKQLQRRIQLFASLPFETIGRDALQTRLASIDGSD